LELDSVTGYIAKVAETALPVKPRAVWQATSLASWRYFSFLTLTSLK
jgi:hypothetical protein